jgi:TPR repeat protein
MFRLGMALLKGELNLSKQPRDGVKWLRLSVKYADERYPQALYELAILHDVGVKHIIWRDTGYIIQLLTRGAELGYALCQHALGEAYQFGKYDVQIDPARSVYYFSLAAENGYAESMFELGGWYLTGASDPATGFELPASDVDARKWVSKAAERGLPRAMYAMGTFLEMGIGKAAARREDADQELFDATKWYKKAADAGDEKAIRKLKERGIAWEKPSGFWKSKSSSQNANTTSLFLKPGSGLESNVESDGKGGSGGVSESVLKFSTTNFGGGVTGRMTGKGNWDEELDGGNKCLVM